MEQRVLALFDDSGSGARTAHVTTSYEENYIFAGNCFTTETVYSVGTGDTAYDIVFDATSVTKTLVALPIAWSTTDGPVIITLGTCTSYTGGTEVTPTNRNYAYQATNPAEVVFTYDAATTGYSAGPMQFLVGVSGSFLNSGGGSIASSLPIILELGVKYVFRVDNQSGDNISLYSDINWYEV